MFGLRSHFRFVNGGEIGVHKWQQIESLLARGKVSRSSVMVGDRAVDLIAAHHNGLQAAGVLWGHGSRSELESEHPSYLFSSPAELASLVGASPFIEWTASSALRPPPAAPHVKRWPHSD
jgi:phosphoglycolate phosphatase